MLILAFDTTNEQGGAGIFRDSQCLVSFAAANAAAQGGTTSLNYSVLLFHLVDRLLAATDLSIREIDLFAVANGPGSFTGIRVGVAAAQAWAQAFSKPVVGISVLGAMIETARPEDEVALAFMDARRGELFAGVSRVLPGTRRTDNPTHELSQELLLKREAVAHFISELSIIGPVTCVIRDNDPWVDDLRAAVGERLIQDFPGARDEGTRSRSPLGVEGGMPPTDRLIRWHSIRGTLVAAIARIALQAHREGRLQRPEELDAAYIRRSDAEMHWHE